MPMPTTVKVRGKVNTAHVKKRYQAGRNKSLDRIGVFTMQSARKQFLNPAPRKKPQWRRVGEKNGIPVLEVTFRPPKPGRVTSWQTGRGRAAKGFLKHSIFYDRDDQRGSVVIGPTERHVVWLNKIQEFGGARPVAYHYLSRRPLEQLNQKAGGHKVPRDMGRQSGSQRRNRRGRFMRGRNPEAYVVIRKDAQTGRRSKAGVFQTTRGKVKPGRYMSQGLAKVRQRIPKAFQNFVSGP
jgi:hypothetical protein